MLKNEEELKPVRRIRNEEIKKEEEPPIMRRRDLYKRVIYLFHFNIN